MWGVEGTKLAMWGVEVAKLAKLTKLSQDLDQLRIDRCTVTKDIQRLESVILPAKSVELRHLADELFEGKHALDKLAEVKVRVQKAQLLVEAVDRKMNLLEADFEDAGHKWKDMVAQWPLTSQKCAKQKLLEELKAKIGGFEAKHGTLESLHDEIADLENRLIQMTTDNEVLERKKVEANERKSKNETILKQLTSEIRMLKNKKAAKLKLLQKAVQDVQ